MMLSQCFREFGLYFIEVRISWLCLASFSRVTSQSPQRRDGILKIHEFEMESLA